MERYIACSSFMRRLTSDKLEVYGLVALMMLSKQRSGCIG
jgi:hypothetical protein